MKALSIKQPWAWLICKGYKDIENRDWPTKFRGRIYVHAGRRFDNASLRLLFESYLKQLNAFGAIIGEVDIVDCVTESKSPWFVGPYGFVLAHPVLYKKPIPCKGKLGFFEPEILYITT